MTHFASPVRFETGKADEQDILVHLQDYDQFFVPLLSEKVNLAEYARKLFDKAVTFEAWFEGELVGLIAGYFNNTADGIGFITNVSVSPAQKGTGIVARLMQNCIDYALLKGFSTISLEVSAQNVPAIQLYKKFGFTEQSRKGDSLTMNISLERST